jgi:Uma2 family endonuclease
MGERAHDVPMTFEDAARLDPDTDAGELDGGTWVPVTRSTWLHGKIVANITVLLGLYLRQQPGLSLSTGDPGTRLSRSPDVLRGPDIGVTRIEREPTGQGSDGWLEGSPELAVEVIGDSQSASELAHKALEYLRAGALIVWVVDPGPRRVIVYTPPNAVAVLGADDVLDGGTLMPGFACKVAELF